VRDVKTETRHTGITKGAILLFGIVLLLAGLGGGFGLGYVIYQPQVENLRNEVTDLTSTVAMMENRSWHVVYSLSSSSDANSGIIQLRGEQVRAMWIATGTSSLASLSVELHFSNGTGLAVWGSSGVWNANNAVLELKETGDYYLVITVYGTSYALSFWDYY
jgi:hypothetical protein